LKFSNDGQFKPKEDRHLSIHPVFHLERNPASTDVIQYAYYGTEKNELGKPTKLGVDRMGKISIRVFLYNGRTFIIATKSQGSFLASRLLKELFDVASNPDNTNGGIAPLKNKLIAAYIIGWPVSHNYFTYLKMCADSLQTGCICSWRTVRKGFIPFYLRDIPDSSYVTNPLNWTTGTEYASKQMNRGSVLTKFNKVYKQTTDVQINNALLNIKKPKFPWSFLYFARNYHVGDINLFYMNIRDNVRQRIDMFWKQ